MMLRNSEICLQFIIHIVISAAGFICCLFFSIPAAITELSVSFILLISSMYFHKKRLRSLSRLCDEIDKTLHGTEHVVFDEFREGEFSILTSEIHKMTIRLREQNNALRHEKTYMKEAMEDISHQLRTPLTSMLLLLGMLRKPELANDQRREYIQELYNLHTRMQWLIETLLSLSRIEAGAVKFQTNEISCKELIAASTEPIAIAVELKNIKIKVNIEDSPSFIGDVQYFTEAIVNLLKNCMEHTPEGGTITVDAQENSIYTQITITDSGKGISQLDIPHIFDRFYRSSEYVKNGYGLGLAFAKKIVTSQNGSLQVRNAKTGGAQFDIRIYKTVV